MLEFSVLTHEATQDGENSSSAILAHPENEGERKHDQFGAFFRVLWYLREIEAGSRSNEGFKTISIGPRTALRGAGVRGLTMRKTPVVICFLLAFGYQSSEAGSGQFVSYKVCHGEKREVCDRHPEFNHFEVCTNSTTGEQGEPKREYICEKFCGVSPAKPGLCGLAPPRYELNAGHKCTYAWFMVKCHRPL
jgi:hypothetical protein